VTTQTTPRAAGIPRGIALTVLAILVFASMDVCSKLLAGAAGGFMPVIQIIWLRFVLFAPLAIVMAYRPGEGVRWRSRRPWFQLARVILLVIEMWLFIAAFAVLPLADAHAIGAIAPLLVTALSVPLLGERVGWRRWAAVTVGFVGMMIILRPGLSAIGVGSVYALFGAALWALYQIVLRIVGRHDGAETTALWTNLVGAALTTAIGPFFWQAPTPTGWTILGIVTVLGGFGHLIYTRAFTLAPASTLQPFSYLLLVFAALFGWLFFGDLPDIPTIIGASLIVASGLYTFHRERVRAAERGP